MINALERRATDGRIPTFMCLWWGKIIAYTHAKDMHFFLHSCGDNTFLMEDLIAAGLDAFHPIQAGCLDCNKTAEQFGSRLSFLYGIDVQHLLPEGTQEQVREGIVAAAKRCISRTEACFLPRATVSCQIRPLKY